MFNLLIPECDVGYFDESGKTQIPANTEDKPSRFNVNGYNFDCRLRHSEEDPKELFPADTIHAEVDLMADVKATILTRPIDDDFFGVSAVSEGKPALGSDEHQTELNRLMDELETIARFGGKNVELVVHETRKMVPPTKSGRALFVVLGAVPPGYTASRHATHLFGQPIAESGYRARLPAPTIDVGYVVKNDLDESIAQIVDDTIYLFVPINRFGISQLIDPTVHLFRRSMNLAWNAYLEGRPTDPTVSQSITEHHEYVDRTMNPHREIARLRDELADADAQIEQAQRILTDGLAKRARLVATIEGTRARPGFDAEGVWQNLQDSPFLDAVREASNGGVYYCTKPLIMTDETGTERYVGRLAISIERPSDILVWSLDNPHIRGVPHPHVNRYGDLCLGNVTQSVSRLLAEQKEAETAVLIMRMLAEGYDRTLTEHKLEEWPTPEEWERRLERQRKRSVATVARGPMLADIIIEQETEDDEPIAPVPHAGGEPDSSGDSGGGRFDWLPHCLRFGQSRRT